MVCCFVKPRTAYEMRISDWSSDVCSSVLQRPARAAAPGIRWQAGGGRTREPRRRWQAARPRTDRKSVVQGTCVSVRVDLGGRRVTKMTSLWQPGPQHTRYRLALERWTLLLPAPGLSI